MECLLFVANAKLQNVSNTSFAVDGFHLILFHGLCGKINGASAACIHQIPSVDVLPPTMADACSITRLFLCRMGILK